MFFRALGVLVALVDVIYMHAGARISYIVYNFLSSTLHQRIRVRVRIMRMHISLPESCAASTVSQRYTAFARKSAC
jgi:hypothetical protein